MNLRKDHYRFVRTCPQGRARHTPPPDAEGVSSPSLPLRGSGLGRLPRGARSHAPLSRGRGAATTHTPLSLDRVPTGRGSLFPPRLGGRYPRPAPLSSGAERRGWTSGPPYRGGSGGATRPVHRSAARKLGTSNLSAVRRPRSRSPSARPRVPNSPPSSGGRRGVQCLHPRSAPVERGGAPGGPVVSFPILTLSPNTGTRRKPQNQTNVTTLSGGSLGSCVDEERS